MEIFDLYNSDRSLSGKTIERGKPIPEGLYRLVVHAVIFNKNGKMLIQRRHPKKPTWPNLWDLSVGGCAQSGEDSYIAMKREMAEEIGLNIDFNPRPLFTFNFKEGFDDVYVIKGDYQIKDMHMQETEVAELKYATLEEILQMIDDETFIGYQKAYIELLFQTYKSEDLYLEVKEKNKK